MKMVMEELKEMQILLAESMLLILADRLFFDSCFF